MLPVRVVRIRPLLLAAATIFCGCWASGPPLAIASEPDEAAPIPRTGPRILCLGDSITAAGGYIHYLETWLLLHGRKEMPTLIGLGLASETASGLSEDHHPFPRPDVHERLDRVLAATQPDVVMACYGMNDGIYHPFSEERFTAYQGGIQKLIRKAQAAGAKRVILLTPPPYAGKASPQQEPADGKDYGYKTPYKDYDDVLARYAQYILSLKDQAGVEVVDVRTPVLKHLEKCFGRDPIHPNSLGHEIMAEAVLAHLGKSTGSKLIDTGHSDHADDARWQAVFKLVAERRGTLDRTWLWEIGHRRPGGEPKLTLAEAQSRAAEIDKQLAALLAE